LIQLNKTQLVLSFICLAALRIAIGAHFFDQGHQKIRSGNFDASGFLKSAKGPFAAQFHSMVPDYEGKISLCYNPLKEGNNKIDPTDTLEIWEEYKNFVVQELMNEEKRLVDSRQRWQDRLADAEPGSDNYLILDKQYRDAEKKILAIRKSRKLGSANLILKNYSDLLKDYLTVNEEEINYYFEGESRLQGFRRDYEIANVESTDSEITEDRERTRRMEQAAKNVNLLREQVDTIASDRKSKVAEWLGTIDGLWKGFEFDLLDMVPLENEKKKELGIVYPTDSASMSFMNNAIPYFDMTVGVLLIIGLFTRTAASAAGLFLVSILMTQAAILGEGSTPLGILYLIETCAVFVLAATCAGRYAGCDYFINAIIKKIFPPKD